MKTIIIVLLIILTFFIGFGLLIFFYSGNPKPFIDTNGCIIQGSISEKVFVDINGSKQGMIIKGRDLNNPVLLYLHGGMPDYFLSQKHPSGLDAYFTVVWWDQRGSGMSYDKNMPIELLNSQQFIDDTKTLSEYLIKRFKKQKIYLMAHSGGTFTGIQAAAQAPELFHAYIAVAQITNQMESEKLACRFMIEEFKKQRKNKLIKTLNEVSFADSILPDSYLKVRDQAMHSLGVGTMRTMKSVVTGLFFPSLFFKEYTIEEKIKLWKAKANSCVSALWSEMLKTDLSRKITTLDIPVYFFHGKYDYTVSYPLAKAYYESIKAPQKQFFSFEESAHSPMFEEPEKMEYIFKRHIINNGLNRTNQ